MTKPWNIYPRPQLRRKSYVCLNGEWDLEVSRSENVPESFSEKIIVPYVPQSALSGIGRKIDQNEILYYRTRFEAPQMNENERLILHFGAVDNHAEVFLNGISVCTHSGGYLPFSVDITDFVKSETS